MGSNSFKIKVYVRSEQVLKPLEEFVKIGIERNRVHRLGELIAQIGMIDHRREDYPLIHTFNSIHGTAQIHFFIGTSQLSPL